MVEQPLHGLMCRRRAKRITNRHDAVYEHMMNGLNKVEGVTATPEPHVGGPGSQRRGDIRVTKDGTTYIVDVGITCPATAKMVSAHKTLRRPGAAASAYTKRKESSYRLLALNHQNGQNPFTFVPFIVETGGRLNDEGRDFIDKIVDEAEPANKGLRKHMFKTIGDTLCRHHAYMLSRLAVELRETQHQAH